MTDPTQHPSQTRRKMAASGPGSPIGTRRTRASVCYVADPTHAVRQHGFRSANATPAIQEIRRLNKRAAT